MMKCQDESKEFWIARKRFRDAYCSAMPVLSNNMTEEIQEKVRMLTNVVELWSELHHLFEGVKEDKAHSITGGVVMI